ncbi:hypothetical protein Tco_0947506 [Tanacetum coccineum]
MPAEVTEEENIKETTISGLTYDSPVNLNATTTVIHDDSEDEADKAEKEVESSSSKQTKKVRINVPLIDVLAGMPNYGNFWKDLVSNKSMIEKISAAFLNKECSHSHSNDDTCFRMDVIDEVTEKELDALLDDSEPFSTTLEKISKSYLDHEFEEFMAIKIEEIPEQEEEAEDNFEELPLEENLRIKKSIQDPPTDLMMKPLPKPYPQVLGSKPSSDTNLLPTLNSNDFL